MSQLQTVFRASVLVLMLAAGIILASPGASQASETQDVIVKAGLTFDKMMKNAQMGSLRRTLPGAKGIVVFPSVLKGAFIFGAEGGTGVMLTRLANGGWSYPAFFTIGAASFGLQIGGEDKEVVLLLMTDKAVNALIAAEVKLGGDLSVSVGPVGAGIEGSTTTAVGADIVAYSLSRGAFIGVAVEGAVVHERDSLNSEYYKPGATAREIVLQGKWTNIGAEELRQTLARF